VVGEIGRNPSRELRLPGSAHSDGSSDEIAGLVAEQRR
jgi:hypothetical protein